MKPNISSQDILSQGPSGYLKWTKHPHLQLIVKLLCLSVPSLFLTHWAGITSIPRSMFFLKKADLLTSPCSDSPTVLAFLRTFAAHILDRYHVPDVMSAGHGGSKVTFRSPKPLFAVQAHRNTFLVIAIQNLGPMGGGYADRKAWTHRCEKIPCKYTKYMKVQIANWILQVENNNNKSNFSSKNWKCCPILNVSVSQ